MRVVAAIFLVSAAVNWPGLVLDRAGVALTGAAALALALPAAARRRGPFADRPRGPALFDGLPLVEPELREAAERGVASLDNGSRGL